MAVRSIDGHVLPQVPGPITRELTRTYWQRREAGWRGTPVETRMEINVIK